MNFIVTLKVYLTNTALTATGQSYLNLEEITLFHFKGEF